MLAVFQSDSAFIQAIRKRNPLKKEILIMGGGLGLIPSSGDFLRSLNDNPDIKVTLIAGKNEKLLTSIREKYDHIEAIGYTDRVDYYMKKADIIVTKAGGITTFEAIASKTPLYVIKPFLEQEFGNAKYIEEHNIGRVLWNKDSDEIEDIVNLIHNDKLLETMKENMSTLIEEFEHSDLYKDTKKEMEKCS